MEPLRLFHPTSLLACLQAAAEKLQDTLIAIIGENDEQAKSVEIYLEHEEAEYLHKKAGLTTNASIVGRDMLIKAIAACQEYDEKEKADTPGG